MAKLLNLGLSINAAKAASPKIASCCIHSTREELAKGIDISTNAIKQHLSNLQKNGKLKRVGGRKDGHWEVKE